MQIDLAYLRQHYATLSDDAFDAIDPGDLVDQARGVYEEERKRRKRSGSPVAAKAAEPNRRNDEAEPEPDDEAEPDWLEDAAIATTIYSYPGNDAAGEADDARVALEAAGIPCQVSALKPEPRRQEPELEYRILVPSRLNMEAASVLDQRVFTQDYADAWKAHFGELTDEELDEVNLEAIFGGLRERIEQITQAYEDERASREGGAKRRP